MARQSIFNTDGSAKPTVISDGPDSTNPDAVKSASDGTINPADIGTASASGDNNSGGNSGDGIRPKRKYRKRGTASQAGETLSVEGLAGMLFSCHQMLAIISKAPELMLDEKEAVAVAQASVNVSRHYGFAPSSKAVDWTNLMMTLGAVYGTRLIAIRNRKRGERRTGKNQEQPTAEAMGDNVVQWPPYPNDGQHNV